MKDRQDSNQMLYLFIFLLFIIDIIMLYNTFKCVSLACSLAVMFVTPICLLFLIKLRWPKTKSIFDLRALFIASRISIIVVKLKHFLTFN